MNLLGLLESINYKIRIKDLGASFSSDASQELLIYKSQSSADNFKRLTQDIELDLKAQEKLSTGQISCFAKQVVNKQCFVDGNHRTALALCYYLSLIHNHELPRIKPYLLYAAIDFEYFKHIYCLSDKFQFFVGNAIETALQAREQTSILSTNLQLSYFEKSLEKILLLADFLEDLKISNAQPHSSSTTQQIKLFSHFAGFRNDFTHSTAIDKSQYMMYLLQNDLLTNDFNPNLDLKKMF